MQQLAERMEEKTFRGKQLFQWVHGHQVSSWDEMSNLSVKFREKLAEEFVLNPLHIEKKQLSKKKDTAKYLFKLPDGNYIESVWMKYHHGNSVCISSQVGCRMGCTFCASTLSGLARNLSAGEMLSQIYEIQRETGERVSNVIVMGMGEPLDNYDNLIRFVKLLSDQDGIRISQRNITVSTCGLVDGIRKLMKEKLQITLAISLHAPNDDIRQQTMPVARRYSMDELLLACRDYFQETKRRITFEYSMIRGVNDSAEQAVELAGRLRGLNCHINLIPLNEVKERSCSRSRQTDIERFKKILEKQGMNVTIRREMGSDIDAACGQLRQNYMNEETK
jgi:23S rRNA (adenine2503-C2)-methyltransferase